MDASFEVDVEVRFRDLDPMNHVNNAVYVTYLEQARAHYLAEVLEVDVDRPGLVVASLDVDYRKPIRWGQDVAVALSVSEIGRSSFTMEYALRADGAVAATAETVQVAVDAETGTSRPIPDELRAKISTHEEL